MKEKFIKAAQQYIYQFDDYPDKEVIRQIEEEYNNILSLNNEEVLNKRLEFIGIGKKEDYLNKFIETSEGTVLAGIRHMGLNPDEPFVYMWPGFKIKNLSKVIEEIKTNFEIFKPKSYRFWIRPDQNDYDVTIIQQRFIAEVEDMVKYELPLIKPEEYYEWYFEQYQKFHEQRPDFKDRVTVNSKEIMNKCLRENLLYQLVIDGKIVGLIAGEYEEFLGESAVYLDEILTSSEFRGKGYASKMLGSFVNMLDVKYFVCDIDSANITSTKTALRAKEKIFSQECMIEL